MALRYPKTIDGSGDYIKFSFGAYKSPFSGPKSTSYRNTIESFTPTGESIFLYLPSEIGSNFSGAWGGKDVTGLAQLALGTFGSAAGTLIKNGDVKGGLQKLLNSVTKNAATTAKDALGGAAADIARYLGEGFSSLPGIGANLSANDVLQLTTESIVNPNTELLYSGTGLRTHAYSFKMIAQSSTEAQNILDVVEAFKKACAPKAVAPAIKGEFRNFIGVPDLCQVEFFVKGKESLYLPKYKVSGITSVNVNYVTDGQFISYQDGRPLGVILSVSFTETKLVFSEEIGTGNDSKGNPLYR